MKTNTKSKIIEYVKKQNGVRPFDLVKLLGITPQAIHRHLRSLVDAGLIESRGRGPKTRYFSAGSPQLTGVRAWYVSIAKPIEHPEAFICESRDVFAGRLSHLSSFVNRGLPESELPLVISVAAEVGNNCFDHNMGHWRDVPGCWFETQATGGRLWMVVADRGQGIFRSLTRTDPSIPTEQAALVAAFERNISGRAPEHRGNGLKFVRNIMLASEDRGVACRSGAGVVAYGRLGQECRMELVRFPSEPSGTVTLILWRMK